jgi:hypothetical protein
MLRRGRSGAEHEHRIVGRTGVAGKDNFTVLFDHAVSQGAPHRRALPPSTRWPQRRAHPSPGLVGGERDGPAGRRDRAHQCVGVVVAGRCRHRRLFLQDQSVRRSRRSAMQLAARVEQQAMSGLEPGQRNVDEP